MADAEVQELLDRAAAELGAGVALGDADDRLIAYTADNGVTDSLRELGITHLRTLEESRSWFEQWGIRDAVRPIRTPAEPSLGALERWCVPVRYRGVHFGYVWILDAGALGENELRPAVEAAARIGARLYEQRLASQVDTDLLRLLLLPSEIEEDALRAYPHHGPVAIIVAGGSRGDELTPAVLSDLSLGVKRAADKDPSRTVLAGMIAGLGVLLAPLGESEDLEPARRLAMDVRAQVARVNGDAEIVAAVGGATELHEASRSYSDAQRALRMVRALPDLGPVVLWDELGVFRPLALLPSSELDGRALDPRVKRLVDDDALALTAETFLDLASNVQATAERLYLHRTTLYQRLERIEELYHLDLLHNGDHRLVAHLGLKLARLTT
jgi:PucR-like helix-turn-helix protein/diguanylate cyclase with GGDEF domain